MKKRDLVKVGLAIGTALSFGTGLSLKSEPLILFFFLFSLVPLMALGWMINCDLPAPIDWKARALDAEAETERWKGNRASADRHAEEAETFDAKMAKMSAALPMSAAISVDKDNTIKVLIPDPVLMKKIYGEGGDVPNNILAITEVAMLLEENGIDYYAARLEERTKKLN